MLVVLSSPFASISRMNAKTGITWRRDDSSAIIMKAGNGTEARSDAFEGELMSFLNVDRRHLGAYLCIAKNDVPPAVSKRVFLNVNCKNGISHQHNFSLTYPTN